VSPTQAAGSTAGEPVEPRHRHAELVERIDRARFDYFVRDSPTLADDFWLVEPVKPAAPVAVVVEVPEADAASAPDRNPAVPVPPPTPTVQAPSIPA